MAAKITKLEEQFSTASDPFRQTNLFAGISIFVNGRTDPSADELKRIMMVHGGTYHHYERSHTTYIIASNLPDVKVRNMNTSKIISAQWVVDCLREGRIVDYTRYLLYSNKRPSQPSLSFGIQKKDEITLSPPSKAISAAVREEVTSEVSAIMHDLQELNAKMRQNVPPQSAREKQDEIEHKPIKDAINANNNGVARTAVDPKFLTEFYNNSRLHHIATLGAGFKQYVSDLREKHINGDFPAREELRKKLKSNNEICEFAVSSSSSYVMHIDMDCFFVSVGLRKYPHLRGQPVAVTHSKGERLFLFIKSV